MLPPSGAELRAQLSEGIERDVAALRRLKPWRRALDLAGFPLLWAAGAALVVLGVRTPGWQGWALQGAGFVAAVVALNAFMLLMHEGMHQLLFRGRGANLWATRAMATPLTISATAYFVLHHRHHRYLGMEGDPDDYRNYAKGKRARWLMHWTRLTLGAFLYTPVIPFSAWPHATAQERRRILGECGVILAMAFAAFAFFPLQPLLVAWVLPGIAVGYITAVRVFSQHGLTDMKDAYLSSRTILLDRVSAFLMLYENYHLEHHVFPDVPSYNLPRLHALVWPRLPRVVTGHSYTGFLMHFLRRQGTLDESPAGLEVR